ncbi:hypothetical protein WICPIJ_009869 [Wickerhamomyces pijperi]|uniref:Uncharacterized protein n=1 Tax=Wickerhamomyces pijperi TaxID=599730 RepID=A0A9P8TCA9_WICPI|nr:hypothetical protein WICPIJ_009869 [Wickerhamomyces pijperi]
MDSKWLQMICGDGSLSLSGGNNCSSSGRLNNSSSSRSASFDVAIGRSNGSDTFSSDSGVVLLGEGQDLGNWDNAILQTLFNFLSQPLTKTSSKQSTTLLDLNTSLLLGSISQSKILLILVFLAMFVKRIAAKSELMFSKSMIMLMTCFKKESSSAIMSLISKSSHKLTKIVKAC